MTRAIRFLFLLVTSALLVPVADAQTAAIDTIRLLDGDGDELRIVPASEFVTVEVTVTNTGSTTIEGPLLMNLTIKATDGSYTRYANLNRPGPVTPGNSTTFTYSWAPAGRVSGDHEIVARMTNPASSEGLVAAFSVADSGVESGTIVERTLSYYWVFGLFLAAIIVFFVVLAARRS